jgi:uncharacterized radical SAM superfamily Fe-S cluster-containing enzyme
MHLPKVAEKLITYSASKVWSAIQAANKVAPEPQPFKPKWSDSPIPRGKARTKPPLGWPRETDSLCPVCVKEARTAILRGDEEIGHLIHDKPGEIKAQIHERDGKIVMVKDVPDARPLRRRDGDRSAFLSHLERCSRAATSAHNDDSLHDHGSRAHQVRPRRGAHRRPDEPLQHDVRPVLHGRQPGGFVHELSWDDIKTACSTTPISVKPRRQMSVQFSGGEPTLSPHFLDAIRYAGRSATTRSRRDQRHRASRRSRASRSRQGGGPALWSTCSSTASATPPTRTGRSWQPVRREAARDRGVLEGGVDVIPVMTIVNGVNNEQVGRIVEFALDNADKITVPELPAGELHGPRRGRRRRDAREAAVHAVPPRAGREAADRRDGEPLRDWFPISALSPFGDVVRL